MNRIAFLIFLSLIVQKVWCQLNAEIKIPQGHTYEIYKAVEISHNKQQVLTCDNKTVIVWDIRTGCPIRVFDNLLNDTSVYKWRQGVSYTIRSALFSADDKYIFVFIWEINLGTPGAAMALQFEKSSGRFIKGLAAGGAIEPVVTSDGKYIIYNTYSYPFECRFIDIKNGKVVRNMGNQFQYPARKGEKDPIFYGGPDKLAWSIDGKRFVMAGQFQTRENNQIKSQNGIALMNAEAFFQKGKEGYSEKIVPALEQFCAANNITHVAISPYAGYFAFYTNANRRGPKKVFVWDIKNNKIIDSIEMYTDCRRLQFSETGDSLFIYANNYDGFKIWRLKDNKLDGSDPINEKVLKFADLNFPGSYIGIIKDKNELVLIDLASLKESWFKSRALPSLYNYFSLDGQKVLTVNAIDIGQEFMTDTLLYSYAEAIKQINPGFVADSLLQRDPDVYYKAIRSARNAFLKKTTGKPNLRVWDLYKGGVTTTIPSDFKSAFDTSNKSHSHFLTTDYMRQSTMFSDYMFRMMDNGPKTKNTSASRNASITSLSDLTRSFIVFWGNNSFTRYMELNLLYYRPGVKLLFNRKKDTVQLYAFDSTDWMMLAQDGYFMSSKNAARSVFYTLRDKVFSFDQFDLQYNRPDKILEYIGIAPKIITGFYRRAYEKRLEKMGFNASDFEKIRSYNVPLLSVIPETDIHSSKNKYFKIKVAASDARFNLNRINLFVNGVPVFGSRGYDLKSRKTKKIKEELTLELSYGNNKVEVAVLNEKGVESLKEEINVNYLDEAEESTLYLITIGAGKYRDPAKELKYAAQDARDVETVFKTNNPLWKHIVPYTFTDEAVTASDILQLSAILKKSHVNDGVIIFYAGHGLINDSLDYFLATYNTDFSHPFNGSLRYENLEKLLDGIPARNKLLVIDACHSGEIDKEVLTLIPADMKTEDGVVQFRQIGNKTVQQKNVGLQNSFEMMQQLFLI